MSSREGEIKGFRWVRQSRTPHLPFFGTHRATPPERWMGFYLSFSSVFPHVCVSKGENEREILASTEKECNCNIPAHSSRTGCTRRYGTATPVLDNRTHYHRSPFFRLPFVFHNATKHTYPETREHTCILCCLFGAVCLLHCESETTSLRATVPATTLCTTHIPLPLAMCVCVYVYGSRSTDIRRFSATAHSAHSFAAHPF